jgi:uncharacterized membrane protein YgcG
VHRYTGALQVICLGTCVARPGTRMPRDGSTSSLCGAPAGDACSRPLTLERCLPSVTPPLAALPPVTPPLAAPIGAKQQVDVATRNESRPPPQVDETVKSLGKSKRKKRKAGGVRDGQSITRLRRPGGGGGGGGGSGGSGGVGDGGGGGGDPSWAAVASACIESVEPDR